MGVMQVAQHADDLDRARAFYEMLLGQPPAASFEPPGLLFFTDGAVRLLLERGAPSATLYFGVDNLAAEVERLRDAGVTIVSEPHPIFHHDDATLGPTGTDEWHAFIRDSEGNLVGLVEHRHP